MVCVRLDRGSMLVRDGDGKGDGERERVIGMDEDVMSEMKRSDGSDRS